jgi:NAD(P)H-flavin reductase
MFGSGIQIKNTSVVALYPALHGLSFCDPFCYIACLTNDDRLGYKGRVTDYLSHNGLHANAIYYLYGNSSMIDEVMDILEPKGIAPDCMKTEVFF